MKPERLAKCDYRVVICAGTSQREGNRRDKYHTGIGRAVVSERED
jgi:hypothetical protein